MNNNWYYVENGQRVGPIPLADLKQLLSQGRVNASQLVWSEGMANWTPAGQVPELAAVAAPASAAAAPGYTGSAPGYAAPAPIQYGSQVSGVVVTPATMQLFRETKPWVRFMSVLMFIGCGLIFLVAVIMLVAGAGTSRSGGGIAAVASLAYLALGLIYLAPAIFLSRYASRIGDLLNSQHPDHLQAAVAAQKSFWKFVGILTIVVLAIYLIVLLVVVAGASGRLSRF